MLHELSSKETLPVADVRPFPALRPDPARANKVCTLPYDVMDRAEAQAMAAGNPISFLRVTRAEIDFGPEVDPYDDVVYDRARENLKYLVHEKALVRDQKPCYYIYKQRMGNHSQLGLVAVTSCQEYEDDIIKKHELTRPDKENDRTSHIDVTGAQTGPVFMTYQASEEIDALLKAHAARDPLIDFTAPDGIQHTAWIVDDDDTIAWIQDAFTRVPVLYIADGHHRSAAAARVAKARAAANPAHKGTEPYNYFLSVLFPHNQVQILPYNRVVKDLCGMSVEDFLDKLTDIAQVEPAPASNRPSKHGEVTMLLDGKWYLIRFIPDPRTPYTVVGCLDVSILQNQVLSPMLGIDNPRTDKRIAFVGGIRGNAELEKMVAGGQWRVAFSMHPTAIDELMAVADQHELMPPKSTWFEPKLRDAMMTHIIGARARS